MCADDIYIYISIAACGIANQHIRTHSNEFHKIHYVSLLLCSNSIETNTYMQMQWF